MVKSLKEKTPKGYDDIPMVTLSNCDVFDRNRSVSKTDRFLSQSDLSAGHFRRFKSLKCQTLFLSILEDRYEDDEDDTYNECYGLFWSEKNACFYEIETVDVSTYAPSRPIFRKTSLENIDRRLKEKSLGHLGDENRVLFDRAIGSVISRLHITNALSVDEPKKETILFKRKI